MDQETDNLQKIRHGFWYNEKNIGKLILRKGIQN